MGRTIYIHIGTEKTGTKSIQTFCCQNNDFLKKHNLYYPYHPEKKYMHDITHWPLAAVLAENSGFVPPDKILPIHEMYGFFLRDIEEVPYDNILISAEPFSVYVIDKKKIGELKKQLSGYNVKIIVYLRRQDHYFVSLTSTKIKGGVHFQDHQISIEEVYREKSRYDYFELLTKWGDVFGHDNLIIRVYERDKMKNRSIIDDFFDIFNIDVSGFPSKPEENISLSLDNLFFLNLLNGQFGLDSMELVYSLLEKRDSGYSIENLISPKERHEILKYYEVSNQKVAKVFLGREDGVLFSEPMPNPDAEWKPFEGLDALKVFEICDYLLKSKNYSDEHIINMLVENTLNEILSEKVERVGKATLIYDLENNVLQTTNMVSEVKKDKGGLHLISTGNDPFIVIPQFENSQYTYLAIHIEISAPEDTILQLFYKYPETGGYSEKYSISQKINKGRNQIMLLINGKHPVTDLRLDPGNVEGEFIIHEFKVFGSNM